MSDRADQSSNSSASSGFLAPPSSQSQEEDRRKARGPPAATPGGEKSRGPGDGGPYTSSASVQRKLGGGTGKTPGEQVKKRRYRPGTRTLMEIRSV